MSTQGTALMHLEFWRRMLLLAATILSVVLFFYKVPALVTVRWVDFSLEQKQLLDSPYGIVSGEKQRLAAMPLDEYIQKETQGRNISLDAVGWGDFFNEIYLSSSGQIKLSQYADRLSPDDIDWLKWGSPSRYLPVFFKTKELPLQQWGLANEGDVVFLRMAGEGKISYLKAQFNDYLSLSGPMDSIIGSTPPSRLLYPYRIFGVGLLVIGLFFALLFPRPKKTEDVIEYARSRMMITDLLGVFLLLVFFGMPFVINGGTVQTITGWWGISLIFWLLAAGPVLIIYASAAYASFQVQLGMDCLSIARRGKVGVYRYDEFASVDLVTLKHPGWFRKLFLLVLALSFLSGGGTPTAAGTYLLSESADYAGLALKSKGGKTQYIWFTDAMGNILLPGFEKIVRAMEDHGVPYRKTGDIVEKFLPLP